MKAHAEQTFRCTLELESLEEATIILAALENYASKRKSAEPVITPMIDILRDEVGEENWRE